MSGHWMDSTERSRAAVIKKKTGSRLGEGDTQEEDVGRNAVAHATTGQERDARATSGPNAVEERTSDGSDEDVHELRYLPTFGKDWGEGRGWKWVPKREVGGGCRSQETAGWAACESGEWLSGFAN